jgi:hypothetical protein
MKLTTSILLLTMAAGVAWAQNPDVIENTKNTLNAVAKKAEMDQNAVLNSSNSQPAKPAAGSAAKPQTAVKPAASTAKPANPAKPASATATPAAKPAAAAAKPVTQPVKPATPAAKAPVAASKPATPAAKPAVPAAAAKPAAPAAKPAAPALSAQTAAKKTTPTKIAIAPIAPQPKQGAQKTAAVAPKKAAKTATAVAPSAKDQKEAAKNAAKPETGETANSDTPREKKTITAEGRRDPFVSPIVSRANGPACSTGKRCLAIDQIMVRGVVKSDNGMIAVVVNSLNKAYFLKENDPVYNGYVLRITGDSVVFKETYQDRLGKELQREVVKKITTPAV